MIETAVRLAQSGLGVRRRWNSELAWGFARRITAEDLAKILRERVARGWC
ncbi:MAG: hypothetical protein KGS09_18060 [Nitrospirae bacterium]|nr:hypothetical protein [Nitrospirota bacterium]MDE3042684.1 hypothetical protein [Nitrospirota bacterium]MDE3219830.1 hypothetical protein [Nitrospirota bacterium]